LDNFWQLNDTRRASFFYVRWLVVLHQLVFIIQVRFVITAMDSDDIGVPMVTRSFL